MSEPYFLTPAFQEKMWGGTRLRDEFGYDLPSDHTGECWAISAHPHGPATVANGPYRGMTLDQVWAKHRDVFGNAQGDVFPLLTKILDAKMDLSVQVHPDDAYAEEHEHELGKTECWYVIKADPGAAMIYGHHAKSRAELREMVEAGQWDQLLRRVPVKAGDFLYVPSGTVHAIGKGIMVLETQQSSDMTYRFYDFDRVDPTTGKKRPLHIEQSIAVANVPHSDPQLNREETTVGDVAVTQFVKTPFFAVYRWQVNDGAGTFARGDAPYTLVSVLDGAGSITVDGTAYSLQKGQHFILPNDVKRWTLAGNLMAIASEPGVRA